MKKTTTLIVLVNGSHARFLLNEGPGKGLKELQNLELSRKSPKTKDIQADKPGRSYDRFGSGRHAMEYSTDPKLSAERKFLSQVIALADREIQRRDIGRVILASSPKVLGELRKIQTPRIQKKLYGELTKDLTHIAKHELSSHLEDILVV